MQHLIFTTHGVYQILTPFQVGLTIIRQICQFFWLDFRIWQISAQLQCMHITYIWELQFPKEVLKNFYYVPKFSKNRDFQPQIVYFDENFSTEKTFQHSKIKGESNVTKPALTCHQLSNLTVWRIFICTGPNKHYMTMNCTVLYYLASAHLNKRYIISNSR